MGRYRCQGCGEYRRRPEFRRLGLGAVCSQQCLWAAVDQRLDKPARPRQNKIVSAEIPEPVRARVRRRDHGRCRVCGVPSRQLHHINYRSQGGDHNDMNLVTLCQRHHDLMHSDKRHYQPLLRALIWLTYTDPRRLNLTQVAVLVAKLTNNPIGEAT